MQRLENRHPSIDMAAQKILKTKYSYRLAPKDLSDSNPASLTPAYVSLKRDLYLVFLANFCPFSEFRRQCNVGAVFLPRYLNYSPLKVLVSNFKNLKFQQFFNVRSNEFILRLITTKFRRLLESMGQFWRFGTKIVTLKLWQNLLIIFPCVCFVNKTKQLTK